MQKMGHRKFVIILTGLLSLLVFVVSMAQAESGKSEDVKLIAEVELRKSLGFRSDIDYVKAVHASEDAVTIERLGEVVLTLAEAQELEVRMNLEEDYTILRNFFGEKSTIQEAFGGIYLDHAAGSEDYTVGGKLILQLVRDHEEVNSIPSILPRLLYPERLRLELVDFSNNRLEQQFQAISSAAPRYNEIRGLFIDRINNQVIVLMIPSDSWSESDGIVDKVSLPESLATLVADSSIIVRQGEIEETVTAVRGGENWQSTPGTNLCTLGFKVLHNNKASMLTAGHCVDELIPGQYVYHDSTRIGTFSGIYKDGAACENCNGIDAGILYMTSSRTATDDVIDFSSYRDIHGETSSYGAGLFRCWTGITSNTQCGYINCESLTYQTTDGRWYTDMFSIDPPGSFGDSGAPAYRPETSSKASVTGIMRSSVAGFGCSISSDAILTKWYHIRDEFGLTLVTDK